jgi:hypothetical protein
LFHQPIANLSITWMPCDHCTNPRPTSFLSQTKACPPEWRGALDVAMSSSTVPATNACSPGRRMIGSSKREGGGGWIESTVPSCSVVLASALPSACDRRGGSEPRVVEWTENELLRVVRGAGGGVEVEVTVFGGTGGGEGAGDCDASHHTLLEDGTILVRPKFPSPTTHSLECAMVRMQSRHARTSLPIPDPHPQSRNTLRIGIARRCNGGTDQYHGLERGATLTPRDAGGCRGGRHPASLFSSGGRATAYPL